MVSLATFVNATTNASAIVSLPQVLTNGNATYGLLNHQPSLPPFLPGFSGPLKCGTPWGCRTVENTNSYDDFPITGVHRNYEFTVERGYLAPDGVNRSMILVNGQFPGPMIEANWGDTVNVKVHNRITGPEEGTSLHWHGLNQKPTPWSDGVPALQQCPIAPGADFQYSFVATNYGSSWYHSHYSAQYAGGAFGPMVIHGPVQTSVNYDVDLGPIMLTDAYHPDYYTLVEQTMSNDTSVPVATSDNNLIQGKAAFACPDTNGTQVVFTNGTRIGFLPNGTATCVENANVAKFSVQRGKKYRLRLINTSADAIQRFTIDGHNVTIFANDFVPIQPYSTNVVTLGVGQRSDVVLEANAPTGQDAFWIRSNISTAFADTIQPQAKAALYYDNATTTTLPKSVPTFEYDDGDHPGNDNLTLTEPVFALPVKEPDLTLNITIGVGRNASNVNLFYMNNSSFRADYNDPLLLEAHNRNTSFPLDPEWNVYNTGEHKTVRIILDANVSDSHPMHLHGHDFYVLKQGHGEWDGSIDRANNPQRRDVQIFPEIGTDDIPGVPNHNRPFLVLQFDQDNPGTWPFHCHIAWHVSAGLYINILERPKDITRLQIPGAVAQTCQGWAQYTKQNVPDEIDSGL